ncbi:hypothetical protein JHK86_053664 [Glycine max]|nr:hypothetical protein JHK86_053664 [Glycine max]
MNYSGCSRGCSPALELKERHNIRRKLSSSSKAKTSKRKQDLEESSVVVLEDLGADYLEALLSTSADQMKPLLVLDTEHGQYSLTKKAEMVETREFVA